jgi:hypothetical protein
MSNMNFPSDKNTELPAVNQEKIPLFPLEGKPIDLSYRGPDISSDGGLLLLREVENQIGLIRDLSDCILDQRDQRYVKHSSHALLSQRIFQIAAGYEDANDCNELRTDSILKICAGQLPESGSDLASQPTMSRFENSISKTEIYRVALCFAQHFVNSYAEEPEVVILDCDDTNDMAHGEQLEIEFNTYYGGYCFMPLHIYEGLSGKLITTILKPGRRSKAVDVFAILKRVVLFLRQYWPNTRIIIRGDSHFCSAPFMDWKKEQDKVNFITGLSKNSKLKQLSKVTIESAQRSYERNQKPVRMYHTFSYKAGSWEEQQRVIVKVEVNKKGTNIRYIVTDLWEFRTQKLYQIGYCARGSMELRIKEHKTYLKSDRTSCHKFQANQFRVFLHSAAYVLMHTLQKEVLAGSHFCNATMKTLQLKLIKIAARVKEMKTKIKIEFPQSCPVAQQQCNAFLLFEALRL